MAVSTYRGDITLPPEVSSEIMAKMQEESAVMRLSRQITLPGRGATINVITGDPTADWVAETDPKPVSDPGLDTKIMQAYKLAVIVPFSDEFRRDVASLYDEIVNRLPGALAAKFDTTVLGGTAPGTNFDTFATVTAQAIGSDAYAALVAAEGDIAQAGGILDGFVLSPQAKSILLAAVDGNQRPLFINNVSEGAIPYILGARAVLSKGAYKAGTPNTVAFAGDWTQAIYGTVEGVKINYSSDATLDLGGGTTVNLFQQNMFAVKAEIEVGFRADTTVFNAITE